MAHRRTVQLLAIAVPLIGLGTAPAQPPVFRGTVSAPVVYKDLMLVLVSADGAAAVVFPTEIEKGMEYKFRYESKDGKTKQSGTGKVFEKRGADGMFDPAGLTIKAGPIEIIWSLGGKTQGWIYYHPDSTRVQIASARDFEDHVIEGGLVPLPRAKLDLSRFFLK